jgi:hypothetical protein
MGWPVTVQLLLQRSRRQNKDVAGGLLSASGSNIAKARAREAASGDLEQVLLLCIVDQVDELISVSDAWRRDNVCSA